jgi:hypothetical protein
MFPHDITGPPQREEIFFREIKNYLKFISLIEVCHNEIFENIFHKFCSFWSSCVLTFVYGRLHGERRKTERKKENVSPLHHRPAHHREKKY